MRAGLLRALATCIALCAVFAFLGQPAHTQTSGNGLATLIADRVEITADGQLVATGNVEAIQGQTRLTAGAITYNPDAETLQIDGPIRILGPDGAVVVAEAAALDTDLRNGLLRSARLVLDRELQLAANEITRVDGRYTQLTRTVTSSCEVCARHPMPLWRIRAEKVIHDEAEKQLYFEDAWFDIYGIPVLYFPRLRLPDPTLERATGFLTPSIRTTDALGFGTKIPYFITLGPHRDLTLTPYVSLGWTRTLEARYRQAFARGGLEINAAVSQDDIREDATRGYLFAEAGFNLDEGYELTFDLELTSDETYLIDYGYSDKDRLDSAVALSRTLRDQHFSAELVGFRSLRSREDNETQPTVLADAVWIQRFTPPVVGGAARIQLETHAHRRHSSDDIVGRDVGRISALGEWRRSWTGRSGMILETRAQLRLDHTRVGDDSRFVDAITEITPTLAAHLRWPWIRHDRSGVTHVIEPAVQVLYSPDESETAPVDESTHLEFDEGNLFALSRFPAGDVLERGLRANLGIGYTLNVPNGVRLGLTFGRAYRSDDIAQFTGFPILEGSESDWLTALRLDVGEHVSLSSRALFDEDYAPSRNDMRLGLQTDALDVAGTWTWMRANPNEGRNEDINEWRIDGAWQIDDAWRIDTDWRYDLVSDRSASAKVGLEYRTDCATFSLSARRRFTSSDQLDPSTDVDFAVALDGFGNRNKRPGRSPCRS